MFQKIKEESPPISWLVMHLEEEMAEGLANLKSPTDRMTRFFEHKATNLGLLSYACM